MRSQRRIPVALAAGALVLTLARCAEPTTGPAPVHSPSLSLQSTVSSVGDALLECPALVTRDYSFTLDARGGRVSRAGVVVDVPAGAIPGRQKFVLTLPRSPYLEFDLSAASNDHYTFARPISITVNYARCGKVDGGFPTLSVWNIDTDSNQLLQRMSDLDDRPGRRITFVTDHPYASPVLVGITLLRGPEGK
jgi:hypothetical protein